MKTKVAALSALMISLPAALFAWGGGNGGCGFGYPGWHMGYGFYGGGFFMMVLLLVLSGLLVFFGVKYFKNGGQLSVKGESALEILKTRYAKGEITKEEFSEMKKEIGGN